VNSVARPFASGDVLGGRYVLDVLRVTTATTHVWSALDRVLDRPVAVKVLAPGADESLGAQLRDDAVALARVNHRHVVTVFDTLTSPDAVIMELAEGTTLREVLDDAGRLNIGDVIYVGAQLADALVAVHAAGLVHRDVRPANVVVTAEGRVLLADHGLVAPRPAGTAAGADDASAPSRPGPHETRAYEAPEQVRGDVALDGRADLYALGAVLYEALAGQPPFSGTSDDAAALARLQRPPLPLRSLRPNVPGPLDDLVSSLMSRDRGLRPDDVRDVHRRLLRFRREHATGVIGPITGETRPIASARPQRRRVRLRPARRALMIAPNDQVVASTTIGPDEDTPQRAEDGKQEVVAAPTNDRVAERSEVRVGRRLRLRPVVLVVALALALTAGSAALAQTRAARPTVSHAIAERPDAGVEENDPTPPSTIAASAVPRVALTTTPMIVGRGEFDPPPGDGRENPGRLGLIDDGDPKTYWNTLCYDEPTMGSKHGVGLVLQLSTAAAGVDMDVTSPTNGWSASVYVSESRRDKLAEWGPPVAAVREARAGTTRIALGNVPGNYVLLEFTRLGSTDSCKLPYEMKVSEISVCAVASCPPAPPR